MTESVNINEILEERGKTHGDFADHALITQSLKRVVLAEMTNLDSGGYCNMQGRIIADDQIESIDMIFHKIGRIVAGNPDVEDHWRDIAGYATLIANRLGAEEDSANV